MSTEVSLVPVSEGSKQPSRSGSTGWETEERRPGPSLTCSQGKGWEPRPIPNLALVLASLGILVRLLTCAVGRTTNLATRVMMVWRWAEPLKSMNDGSVWTLLVSLFWPAAFCVALCRGGALSWDCWGPGLRRLHTLSHPLLSPAKNMVVRGLENVEAPEGGEALFECQLSQPEVAAHTWLLDDEPVLSSENAEVVYFENGLRHLLLLKNLRPQDSCRVTFLAGDMVTSAFLTVRGAGCQLPS